MSPFSFRNVEILAKNAKIGDGRVLLLLNKDIGFLNNKNIF